MKTVQKSYTLARAKVLAPCVWRCGTWCWTREGEDEPFASLRYEADMADPWLG
jgi:hypothetical protein